MCLQFLLTVPCVLQLILTLLDKSSYSFSFKSLTSNSIVLLCHILYTLFQTIQKRLLNIQCWFINLEAKLEQTSISKLNRLLPSMNDEGSSQLIRSYISHMSGGREVQKTLSFKLIIAIISRSFS
jgi:hypothetical protein